MMPRKSMKQEETTIYYAYLKINICIMSCCVGFFSPLKRFNAFNELLWCYKSIVGIPDTWLYVWWSASNKLRCNNFYELTNKQLVKWLWLYFNVKLCCGCITWQWIPVYTYRKHTFTIFHSYSREMLRNKQVNVTWDKCCPAAEN